MPEYSYNTSDYHFSQKFSLLRNFYQISFKDLSALMNYKSKGNLTNFEKFPMPTKPSYQALVNLQQIFGISLDWMLGSSKLPYTEETVRQAEIEQAQRFVYDKDRTKMVPDTPESMIDFLKTDLLPNQVIQKKLHLSDRFVLLYLLNYLSVYFVQYYVEHHDNQIQKKFHSMKEKMTGKSLLAPDSIKRHPDYMPAFLQLREATKSPLGIPYSLYHLHNVLPGQDKMERLDHPVLDERWDFIKYLENQGIEVDRGAYTDK